jgi:hypothetical protein
VLAAVSGLGLIWSAGEIAMAIIINEFEIIPTTPPPVTERTEPLRPAPPPVRLRPEEVERIIQRQRQRLARLWAD